MSLKKIQIAPLVVKSEPNTPIYATTTLPDEAPLEWFALWNHKEKLAIMTMEEIPDILHKLSTKHATTSPTQYFSPALLPLLDRMKFHFSRMMAHARCEAENGVFIWRGGESDKKPRAIQPEDTMSAIEVEAFLGGIEEIRLGGKDNRVVMRRYWRILNAPPGLENGLLGGVVTSGSPMKHHRDNCVKKSMEKHWNEVPKYLLAEFMVGSHGLSLCGKTLQENAATK